MLSVYQSRSLTWERRSLAGHCLQWQGAYDSGKPGNLREFGDSGKLGEYEIYSGNFCISDGIRLKYNTSRPQIVTTCNSEWNVFSFCLQWLLRFFSIAHWSTISCVLHQAWLQIWLLRWFVTSGFHFIIVWKRLLRGSGKPGNLR